MVAKRSAIAVKALRCTSTAETAPPVSFQVVKNGGAKKNTGKAPVSDRNMAAPLGQRPWVSVSYRWSLNSLNQNAPSRIAPTNTNAASTARTLSFKA